MCPRVLSGRCGGLSKGIESSSSERVSVACKRNRNVHLYFETEAEIFNEFYCLQKRVTRDLKMPLVWEVPTNSVTNW
jgi:hypothetical protein